MLCLRELLEDSSVWTNADKCQIKVDASVPAARMKDGHVLWVVERDKVIKVCPSNKALFIGTASSVTPVGMQTIKIASTENGVREQWEIRRLQAHRWRFVDIEDFININICTTTQFPM